MADQRPPRLTTCSAFAVFGPTGKIETARTREDDAVAAARIIGGSNWESEGFTVEAVTVSRFQRAG